MEVDAAVAQVTLVASGQRLCHVPHGAGGETNSASVIPVLCDNIDGQVPRLGHGGRDRGLVSPIFDNPTRFIRSCWFGIGGNKYFESEVNCCLKLASLT